MTNTFHSNTATLLAIIVYIAIVLVILHDAFILIGGMK